MAILPSPISRLPVELLSCIFMLSSEPDTDECLPFDSSTVRTPLILSRVCKHWRDVARSTPRLWARICITSDLSEDDGSPDPPSHVNMRHINTCLSLSRNCPLDILIDARDEDWDFSEPEIMPVEFDSTHDPSFAPALIESALPLLTPHLRRWKSLTILTDTWAPMFVALYNINPHLTTLGAPLLESLTLMRCNDFVSFSPEFRPRHLAKPEFLTQRKHYGDASVGPNNDHSLVTMLPRLKHLTLGGVHVNWEALAGAVEDSQVGGLKTLCLSSHSLQVRPTQRDFRRLLNASAGLEALSVRGSGPASSSDTLPNGSVKKLRLEKLQRVEVGYRSVGEAKAVFELISAPATKGLVLEDVSHPADLEDVDGRGVLACLSEKAKHGQHSSTTFYDVQELTLRNVKFGKMPTGQETLRNILHGTARLKGLNVEDVEVEIVLRALIPEGANCPCPGLESLTMKVGPTCKTTLADEPESTWLELIRRLVEERKAALPEDSKGLQQIRICVECPHGVYRDGDKAEASIGETLVVIETEGRDRCFEDEGVDEHEVHSLGGPFNESIFDTYWDTGFPAAELGFGLERVNISL